MGVLLLVWVRGTPLAGSAGSGTPRATGVAWAGSTVRGPRTPVAQARPGDKGTIYLISGISPEKGRARRGNQALTGAGYEESLAACRAGGVDVTPRHGWARDWAAGGVTRAPRRRDASPRGPHRLSGPGRRRGPPGLAPAVRLPLADTEPFSQGPRRGRNLGAPVNGGQRPGVRPCGPTWGEAGDGLARRCGRRVDGPGDVAPDTRVARPLTCADGVHRVWTRNCGSPPGAVPGLRSSARVERACRAPAAEGRGRTLGCPG